MNSTAIGIIVEIARVELQENHGYPANYKFEGTITTTADEKVPIVTDVAPREDTKFAMGRRKGQLVEITEFLPTQNLN